MDTNTVLVIALFVLVVIAILFVFRDKLQEIRVRITGPANTGFEAEAKKASPPPVMSKQEVSGVKSGGNTNVQQTGDDTQRVTDVESTGDTTISQEQEGNEPNP